MTLKKERVREILDGFAAQRILVVGDLMLDRFIYGDVTRISPEAPVPVVCVSHETDMPGGASNVARNIQSLGGQSIVSGVIGCDAYGDTLLQRLQECEVAVDGVMRLADRATTVKTRIIAEHQQVVRVDWDCTECMMAADQARFTTATAARVAQSTGVVIEDYGKGVVFQDVVSRVIEAARAAGVPSGIDPKDNHELQVSGVTVATPNRAEAFMSMGVKETNAQADPLTDQPLLEMAKGLRKKWNPELLLLTLGGCGMLLVERDVPFRHIPTRAREVFDVSGAGDTVIATCLLALAAGATYAEAAELANYAAGVVVGKLGTATCSNEELLGCFV